MSVITEKDDLSFQLTYQGLIFAFQTRNAERHALLPQYVKGTTNSGTRSTYFKCTDFSTTYHRSAQLAKEDLSFQRQSKNTKRYTENTLHRRKIEMVNARLLVQQFTHPVHPNSSFRLSYLLRQFLRTGREKYAIDAIGSRQKVQAEKTRQQYTGKHFSF